MERDGARRPLTRSHVDGAANLAVSKEEALEQAEYSGHHALSIGGATRTRPNQEAAKGCEQTYKDWVHGRWHGAVPTFQKASIKTPYT